MTIILIYAILARNPAPLGAAIGAGLFSSQSEEKPMQRAADAQACIRSAMRQRRRILGLTQEHTGRLLGMSRMSYHRIETGARRIRFSELAIICAAFNCHIGELVQDGHLASAYTHAAKAILGEGSP
jgi:DNA-binding Xre family transcriptional regulator